ncbi:hypothetical protein DV736_g1701, partial [Chaetothyriales sp. CBS 134916]
MPQSRELDPLLPQNESSPEIYYGSGPGTVNAEVNSKETRPSYQPNQETEIPLYQDNEDNDSPPTSARFTLQTFVSVFTAVIFFAFVSILLSPEGGGSGLPFPSPKPRPSRTLEQRVSSILRETPLIDGHNDLAIFIRAAYKNKIHTDEFRSKFEDGGMLLNVDLPRLDSGLVGGVLWSAFVGCPQNASADFSEEQYASAVAQTLSQIDLIRRLQAQYPSKFTPATSPLLVALDRFHASRSLISPISIEGLHQLPQSAPLSTLRLYHSLGVRAATLTWNCHNRFADAALITSGGKTVIAPYHRGGLTSAGRQVIHEMNRLGILIDLSHTSYWTQQAVLSNASSLAPVIYSHSSAFSLCPHPRNVHDDILELVKATKSLVMINFSPAFISCLPPPDPLILPEFYDPNNTLHQVARHIVYIGEKIGYDYVGLGSDFDGMGFLTPRGLEGVEKYPDLVKELLKLGVKDSDASKLVGGNLLRVWREAETVAKRLQKEEEEGEDDIKDPFAPLVGH